MIRLTHLAYVLIFLANVNTSAAADCYPVTPAEILVHDGDTIIVGDLEARLHGQVIASWPLWWRLTLPDDTAADPKGFDTPELHGRCEEEKALAKEAAERLRALADAGGLRLCTDGRRGRYGRLLGTLSAGGVNVGEVLLREGLARHWPEKEIGWCK